MFGVLNGALVSLPHWCSAVGSIALPSAARAAGAPRGAVATARVSTPGSFGSVRGGAHRLAADMPTR